MLRWLKLRIIRERGSKQREAVYDTVKGTVSHPEAQWVYDRLKPEHPKLSLGTVYRNLDTLVKSGSLLKLEAGGTARYDASTHPHYHFSCTCCGGLSDIGVEYQSGLDELAGRHAAEVVGHTLIFHGLCPKCAQEVRAAKREKD